MLPSTGLFCLVGNLDSLCIHVTRMCCITASGSAGVNSTTCSEGSRSRLDDVIGLRNTRDTQRGILKLLLPLIRKEVKDLGY